MNLNHRGSPDVEAKAQACVNLVGAILSKTAEAMPDDAGSKLSLLLGVALIPLTGVSVVLGDAENDRLLNPDQDQIVFGACYAIAGLEKCPEGYVAGYSPDTVIEALRVFRMITGRDYDRLAPALVTTLERVKDRANNIPDNVKGFLPH